jgi:hypothetical protein
MFPPRLTSSLADARGPAWEDLVTKVARAGLGSREILAFVVMVARLSGCASCTGDSYRAAQGCTICAGQALKRFHGTDRELVKLFESAQAEVDNQLPRRQTGSSHSKSI